jgi:hypothetical protein
VTVSASASTTCTEARRPDPRRRAPPYGFEIAVDAMRTPDAVIWTLRVGRQRKIG